MKPTRKLSKQDRIEFRSKHVRTYSSTGLTQRAYCQKNNLSYWSFNSWKRKLENQKTASKFIEISAGIKTTMPSHVEVINKVTNFEIILRNGLRISIPEVFNSELFKQIITAAGELS